MGQERAMVAGMWAGAVAAAVLAAGGGVSGDGADCREVRARARFAPPTALIPSAAVTYDMRLVPASAWIEVEQRGDEAGTTVSLRVKGLKPGHAYGAHVHRKPCGADPEAAGGHYQHRVDPVQPSKNPAYLNPRNEVWLDFTARAGGSGSARAHHRWGFRPGEAASVVLHREQGGAGDRIACFTVPFEPRG
ncbi:superoxide dismutase [Streptomyces sp. WAC 01529]|uniref:superoxide dismutase family protein n=1 Tax=Streptomyces sp. WAC 01529 TaxID=2203205 RepID=UPI000F71F4E8|nr:superoxide dismutase family protein [Streptomyces sp. WAC 01529]AZM53022.1 superoxide dismutase [Streptomyces sp. WAC 01529]